LISSLLTWRKVMSAGHAPAISTALSLMSMVTSITQGRPCCAVATIASGRRQHPPRTIFWANEVGDLCEQGECR
jgi:hypothetical protein